MTALIDRILWPFEAAVDRVSEVTKTRPRAFGTAAFAALVPLWMLFYMSPGGAGKPLVWAIAAVSGVGIPAAIVSLWAAFDETDTSRFWSAAATGLGCVLALAFYAEALQAGGWVETMGDEAVRQVMLQHPAALVWAGISHALGTALAVIVLDLGDYAWSRVTGSEVTQ